MQKYYRHWHLVTMHLHGKAIDSIPSVPGIGNSHSAPYITPCLKVLNEEYMVAIHSYVIGGICWQRKYGTFQHLDCYRIAI